MDFDLHTSKSRRGAARREPDRGLVECDLGVRAEGVDATTRPHLEQRRNPPLPRDSADTLADRPVHAAEKLGVGPLELLGQLAPYSRAGFCRRRAECLERHLALCVRTSGGAADAKRVPGPVEAPVIRVEVEIDVVDGADGCDRRRLGAALCGMLLQPADDRTQVQRVELPLELTHVDRIHRDVPDLSLPSETKRGMRRRV